MIIKYAESFDHHVDLFPDRTQDQYHFNTYFVGPQKLLDILSLHLGLLQNTSDSTTRLIHLKNFLDTQILQSNSKKKKDKSDIFYLKSYKSDAWGVSKWLLQMRDELILMSLDLKTQDKDIVPLRLKDLMDIEKSGGFLKGDADQWILVERNLQGTFITRIESYDREELLPTTISRVFDILSKQGTTVNFVKTIPSANKNTDLGTFQQALASGKSLTTRSKAKDDGSISIYKYSDEIHLAKLISTLIKQNCEKEKASLPFLMIQGLENNLDEALHANSIPTLGLARTILTSPQEVLLHNLLALIWEPLDINQTFSFLQLRNKLISSKTRLALRNSLVNCPGIGNSDWNKAIDEIKDPKEKKLVIELFSQKRFDPDGGIDRGSLVSFVTKFLPNNTVFLQYLVQCETTKFTQVELETFIAHLRQGRTQKAHEGQQGSCPWANIPGTIHRPVEELYWAPFIEPTLSKSTHWQKNELDYFKTAKLKFRSDDQSMQSALYSSLRNLLQTKKLMLFIPEQFGENTTPHWHYADLCTLFENAEEVFLVNESSAKSKIKIKNNARLKPSLKEKWELGPNVDLSNRSNGSKTESYSSLNLLYYFPSEWVLQHHFHLCAPKLSTIPDVDRLEGTLYHRMVELIAEEEKYPEKLTKSYVKKWIKDHFDKLIVEEAAILNLRENESARKRVKDLAESTLTNLFHHFKENSWKIEAVEFEDWKGVIAGKDVTGFIDILLKRKKEWCVVDLKLSGSEKKKKMIRDNEDLQLTLYAQLVKKNTLAHSAFYLLSNQEFLSKDPEAFREAIILSKDNYSDLCETLMSKLESTVQLRLTELKKGTVLVEIPGLKKIRYAYPSKEYVVMKGKIE